MQNNVIVGETFSLEGVEEGIVRNGAVVNGDKDILSVLILTETHVFSEPAFHSAALIVIASGALDVIFVSALEAVDIELPQVAADLFKVFNQFAVSHCFTSLKKSRSTMEPDSGNLIKT